MNGLVRFINSNWIFLLAASLFGIIGAHPILAGPPVEKIPSFEALNIDRKCSDTYGNLIKQLATWHNFLMNEIDAKKSIAEQMEKFRQNHGLPFWVTPRDNISAAGKALPDRMEMESEMSGMSYFVFLKQLPAENAPYYTDPVWEFDAAAKQLRRWVAGPFENEGISPAAVEGDTLYFEYQVASNCYSNEKKFDAMLKKFKPIWLAIKTDGQFVIAEPQNTAVKPKSIPCNGKIKKNIPNSAYLQCWEYQDMKSGANRILVDQAPMT